MTYSSKNVDIKFSRLIHSFYPKCSSINRVLKYSFQATSGSKNNIIVNISYYLVLRTWMVTRVNSSKKKLKSHTELWRTCLSLNRRIVEIRDFLVDNDRLVFGARTVSNNSTKQAVSKLHATLSWLVPSDAALARYHALLFCSCFMRDGNMKCAYLCSYWQVALLQPRYDHLIAVM